jgi:hypothetical protein
MAMAIHRTIGWAAARGLTEQFSARLARESARRAAASLVLAGR